MAAVPQRRKSASRIPDVDPKSAAGVALTSAVQDKLRQFLGADYTDRSLAQYVVVMLAHKTEQEPLGDNLVEFLGEVDAREIASWLFENLHQLVKPPPEPAPAQPAAQQQQQQQQQGAAAGSAGQQAAAAAAAAAAAGQEQAGHEGLDLELDQAEEDGEEGGSDADTAEVAPEGHAAAPGRRLLSAVVVDADGRRRRSREPDTRRARTRSRSRSPRRRRSSYSPPGRRRSPAPRRHSPQQLPRFSWEGATGSRYHGHDPYPYRQKWRPASPPPRRGRTPSPPRYSRGHGRGEWGRPWSPRASAGGGGGGYAEDPRWWGGPPVRLEAPGGGGVFARMLPAGYPAGEYRRQGPGPASGQHPHVQHDLRWEEEREAERQLQERYLQRYGEGGPAPDGLRYSPEMGQELLPPGGGQQAQRGVLAGGPPPWERPSYMDLESQRQQQAQQAQQAARPASIIVAPQQQQQQQQRERDGRPAEPAAAAFARALSQAAASLAMEGRSVAAVHAAGGGVGRGGQAGGGTTFQVTITQQQGGEEQQEAGQGAGQGADQHQQQEQGLPLDLRRHLQDSRAARGGGFRPRLTAPLLAQAGLQEVLRQKLRQMELELVKLRAEAAERKLAEVQRGMELSAAAKLDLTVRSVCVRGVHVAASERVLIAHFGSCGYIQQITFLRDPVSGRKTGVVYIQFGTAAQAQAALALDGSALLQRPIQVVPSDSPAARVAVSRVLRSASSFPAGGLVAMPVLAAPVPPPRGRAFFHRNGSGGGHAGRGHGSFKYVREAEPPAPGSSPTAAAAGAAAAVGAAAEAGKAAAGEAAAGDGMKENGAAPAQQVALPPVAATEDAEAMAE